MEEQKTGKKRSFWYNLYDEKYKILFIIPVILLVLSMVQIGYQYHTTGDFFQRSVSLKGGSTFSVESNMSINADEFQKELSDKTGLEEINVRTITNFGSPEGILIESSAFNNEQEANLKQLVSEKLNVPYEKISVQRFGPSLGESFFKETFKVLILAFVVMGLVVFYYFRIFIPSFAIMLAALSDMVITLAVFNLFGMRLSTAGIAAFLMLIGYSVDTDILLSTRVIKRNNGTVVDRIFSSMKTGMTMTTTTLVAVVITLIFVQSGVLRQIMIILLIGLLADIINTWMQNAALLRWYKDGKD